MSLPCHGVYEIGTGDLPRTTRIYRLTTRTSHKPVLNIIRGGSALVESSRVSALLTRDDRVSCIQVGVVQESRDCPDTATNAPPKPVAYLYILNTGCIDVAPELAGSIVDILPVQPSRVRNRGKPAIILHRVVRGGACACLILRLISPEQNRPSSVRPSVLTPPVKVPAA